MKTGVEIYVGTAYIARICVPESFRKYEKNAGIGIPPKRMRESCVMSRRGYDGLTKSVTETQL